MIGILKLIDWFGPKYSFIRYFCVPESEEPDSICD